MNEFTPEDKNALRAFLDTSTGGKLLNTFVQQEVTLLAQGFNDSATQEKQSQIMSKVAGIYWVRTLLQDLTAKPLPPKKIRNIKGKS